ncbi:MAG: thiamine-phosphate kinase [Planctomycetota bacterium]
MSGIEQQFVEWLKSRKIPPGESVVTGIGDDAAVVKLDGQMVVTTDTISDGTHFDLTKHRFSQIGHKALGVSLSDLAGMAARPRFATISYSLPTGILLESLVELFDGSAKLGEQFGCSIIGGDTNSWDGPLSICTTAIGSLPQDFSESGWRLSAGKPGDKILVTGSFGGSISGRHLEIAPRCELALRLRDHFTIHAATDVTDSLTHDLQAILSASGCGARIDLDAIPIHGDSSRLAGSSGRSPLEHALYDGEDFELILTCNPATAEAILSVENLETKITEIGMLTEGSGIIDTVTSEPVSVSGYQH